MTRRRVREVRPGRGSAFGRGLRSVVLALLLSAVRVESQVSSLGSAVPTLSAVAAWNARAQSDVGIQATAVTLLVTSGGSQSIGALVDGSLNPFPAPVRVTTQWTSTTSLMSTLDLVGYFAAPAAALSNGTTHLGSGLVEGRMSTGRATAFTPFTQGPVGGQGVVGGTLHLFRQRIVASTNGIGQRNDQLDLRLNLRGQPALAPGVYQGTLTLRASVY